jgi:hypothetical protein
MKLGRLHGHKRRRPPLFFFSDYLSRTYCIATTLPSYSWKTQSPLKDRFKAILKSPRRTPQTALAGRFKASIRQPHRRPQSAFAGLLKAFLKVGFQE